MDGWVGGDPTVPWKLFLENQIASATNRPDPGCGPNLAKAPLTRHERGPVEATDSSDNAVSFICEGEKKISQSTDQELCRLCF